MLSTLKALVSGHPRDAKKVSITERKVKNTELRNIGSCEGGHK